MGKRSKTTKSSSSSTGGGDDNKNNNNENDNDNDYSSFNELERNFGKTLLVDSSPKQQQQRQPTSVLLKGKKLVGLYFTSSWNAMGKEFTPQLVEFYETCCRSNNDNNNDNSNMIMEIVYVSSDDNRNMFLETFADMPWLAMDGDDEGTRLKHSLATKLKVFRLPSLLILNVETGHFITDYARQQVQALFEDNDEHNNNNNNNNKNTTKSKEKSLNVLKGKELVQKWATQEPEQLGHANTFANKALLTFNHFKKNPIYVVGIVALLLFTNTLRRVEQNPLLGMAMVYLLFTLGKEPLDKNVPYIRQEEDVSNTPNEKKKA